MTRLVAFALLATGLSFTAALAAQPISIRANTAGELAENCGANAREPAADAKINFCIGFAQGAIDVELHYAADKKPFCIPKPGPSRATTVSEFANWVRAMPDRGSMPAAPALIKFMGERFPCK
jgi:hypothetical protein